MLHKTLERLRPAPAGALALAALVVGLTFICTQRALAAVLVPNISTLNITVANGATSAFMAFNALPNNPTLITLTDRTPNDGIVGIASFAVTWISTTVPQIVVWTGTASGALVGGQTNAPGTKLATFGIGVEADTALSGVNLRGFQIKNTGGSSAAINITQIW